MEHNQHPADLLSAVRANDIAKARRLIGEGANPNDHDLFDDTPLYISMKKRYFQMAQLLLEAGADPDALDPLGYSLLHYAAAAMRKIGSTFIELLLEYGANVNAKSDDGDTPLTLAVANGSIIAVQLLLEAGANPNIKPNNGISPLATALLNRHSKIARELLRYGAGE